jgi:hypothetical protein
MNKEIVVHVYHGILFSNNEELNNVVCRNMDGIEDHHVEQDKPSSKR